MRRLKWMIPLLAITIFLFSVGLASANMTSAVLNPSTGAASGDAMQLAQSEKEVGIRKGYRGTFSTGVTGAGSGDPFPQDVVEVEKKAGTRKGYVGTYFQVENPDFFSVSTRQGIVMIQKPTGGDLEPITKLPGGPWAGELVNDARVAVLVDFVSDGGDGVVREARKIVLKPTPAKPVNGAVESVDTNDEGVSTVTIVSADGTTEEVELDPEAGVPEVGEVVVGFRGRGHGARARRSGEVDDDGHPRVRGLVRAQQVHERLRAFLENLGSNGQELSDEQAEQRDRRIEKLGEILEKHAARNVVIIERLSNRENLPPQAAEAVAKGLDKAKDNRERARANRERARAKWEQAKAAREEARSAREDFAPGNQNQNRGGRNPR